MQGRFVAWFPSRLAISLNGPAFAPLSCTSFRRKLGGQDWSGRDFERVHPAIQNL
jgi:hypothetical protein